MTYRVRNIAVAVGLALLAAVLTTFYVTNYKRHVQNSESTVTVYTAKRDIPQGTPGTELVKHGWLTTSQVAQRTVVPGAISSPDQVRNLLTKQDVYAGEQVTLRSFASNAQQGVRVQLHGTLRAVTLTGLPDNLLAGTVRNGDHIDVVANLKTGDCSVCFAVRVVARNVLVLRAPDAATASKVSNTQSSVMLAVSDRKEEQKIWYAVQNATGWALALRPVSNAADSPDAVEGLYSLLRDKADPSTYGNYVGGQK